MVLRVPYYYDKFSCLADRCTHICCRDWEIDIDEDTFAYYQTLGGEWGDRIRANITKGEEGRFILSDGKCPFLNEKNLCGIYIGLGEQAQCEICAGYPRYSFSCGDILEKCISISCEEAARLVFLDDTPFYIVETELSDEQEDVSEEEKERVAYIEKARACSFLLLQDRTKTIEVRIADYLDFAEKVQNGLNDGNWQEPKQLAQKAAAAKRGGIEQNAAKQQEFCADRIAVFEELEVLEEEWTKTFSRVTEVLHSMTEEAYLAAQKEFASYYQDRQYEYEHLMEYFTFRYFMKSVYDNRFLEKAKFAVAGFLMIRDMDVVRFLDQGGTYDKKDRIDMARIYSKQVEYSEDNMELLSEDFDFEEVFDTALLMQQILLT